MSGTNQSPAQTHFKQIPFTIHPRVFAALGTDLVTNDVVAVLELVKNSYDAFAENVWIRFKFDDEQSSLEVEDDGRGMNEEIIRDVWSSVATPYKADNPVVQSGSKIRRVTGEKGLGRLSVARLGSSLRILTRASGEPCWELKVDWSEISQGEDLSQCYLSIREYPDDSPFEESGTLLQIENLKSPWDESDLHDLEQNLARLISPFADLGAFRVSLSFSEGDDEQEICIESPQFLSRPKYLIVGTASKQGDVNAQYTFAAIKGNNKRTKDLSLSWEQIYDSIQEKSRTNFDSEMAHCGKFSFEIRGWDISSDDTSEIAEAYEVEKMQIRKAIGAHKGLSVYRDGVLVLPKSEGARDWLGLDLRRVSKVGTRMSTSQLVGYIAITADDNPAISDTSDRERLVSCREVEEFEEILKAVIALLEIERANDRVKDVPEKSIQDLFSNLSAEKVVEDIASLASQGAKASDAVPIVEDFRVNLDAARKDITERFVYYSGLATIGTIAHWLVHEIRHRTTMFGSFLDFLQSRFGPLQGAELKEYQQANRAVDALERLADKFSPLANRRFKRTRRKTVLQDAIREILEAVEGKFKEKKIDIRVPETDAVLAVDPGEFEVVILNLLDNSLYWVGSAAKANRQIHFRFSKINKGTRLKIWVHDSGPGIKEEDLEKIFLPGVSNRPSGIGMGLTIASEIVKEYGGEMITKHPGTLGGASFGFDVPLTD